MEKEAIQDFLATCPKKPGVYQMFDAQGQVIYVGKAKQLHRRVSSYFNRQHLEIKTLRLVENIARIEVIVVADEREAFLLEDNLIKLHRPRYNILFRDDKSYPYIYVSTHEAYPRVLGLRGKPYRQGVYFGPYPSMRDLRETLTILVKIFQIRQCEPAVFRNRSRPCLQHQIKRCSGPCVGLVEEGVYRETVDQLVLFLSGRAHDLIEGLVVQMNALSAGCEFERAAVVRDRIKALKQLQSQQVVHTDSDQSVDVIGFAGASGFACVDVLTIRHGRLLGNKAYFPDLSMAAGESAILLAFLRHYYIHGRGRVDMPSQVILPCLVEGVDAIDAVLAAADCRAPSWASRTKLVKRQWKLMARANAEVALRAHLAKQLIIYDEFEALGIWLGHSDIELIDCFDISHTQGEEARASCVVFDRQGPLKAAYRRFVMRDIVGGDDYGAIYQAVHRRYCSVRDAGRALANVVVIDGGKGQIKKAAEALRDVGLLSEVILLSLSKGPQRRDGDERVYRCVEVAGELVIEEVGQGDGVGFYLLQRVRDEAHRFAITGHRQARDKKRRMSLLEGIPGVGAKRRQALLDHFGGYQALKAARVEEIAKVPGMSERLAAVVHGAVQAGVQK